MRSIIITCATLFLVVSFCEFISIGDADAVAPPSVARKRARQMDAEAARRHRKRKGCRYGWDTSKNRCYQPKEGQLYRDPRTGEMKMKKIEKVNLPWN
jgi:ribosome assembly protein YihI (activator of Der GTPase)